MSIIKSAKELQAEIDHGNKNMFELYHPFRRAWVPIRVDSMYKPSLIRAIGDGRLRAIKFNSKQRG